jgi:hypothetical protein
MDVEGAPCNRSSKERLKNTSTIVRSLRESGAAAALHPDSAGSPPRFQSVAFSARNITGTDETKSPVSGDAAAVPVAQSKSRAIFPVFCSGHDFDDSAPDWSWAVFAQAKSIPALDYSAPDWSWVVFAQAKSIHDHEKMTHDSCGTDAGRGALAQVLDFISAASETLKHINRRQMQ